MSQNMYTTTTKIKRRLGIAGSDTSKDALISDLIEQASADIDEYTGRSFGNAADGSDATEQTVLLASNYTPDTWGARGALYIGTPDVISITEIKDAYGNLIDVADYELDTYYGRVIGLGSGQYSVKYKAGYTGVPSQIESAAINLVVSRYNATNRSGVTSVRIGDYQESYGNKEVGDFDASAIPGLSKWRAIRI